MNFALTNLVHLQERKVGGQGRNKGNPSQNVIIFNLLSPINLFFAGGLLGFQRC